MRLAVCRACFYDSDQSSRHLCDCENGRHNVKSEMLWPFQPQILV